MGARFNFSAVICAGLTIVSAASAQMDAVSTNLLIDKLDKVNLHLAANDPSKVAVTLRLADLYADRARQEAMKAGDGCFECPAVRADRDKALFLYGQVIDRAPETVRGKITLQMGHLNQMLGNDSKAIHYFEKNLKHADAALVAESNMALAELYFKQRNFAKAVPHYSAVLTHEASPSLGVATYRRAWSYFHLGRRAEATTELEKVLSTPALLVRGTVKTVDEQFKEEVARDLVTFISKDSVNPERIELLFKMSPESTRVANVQALGYELERLSRKDEALLVWKFTLPFLTQPANRLAANLSLAQLFLDKNDKEAALKYYESAMKSWTDAGAQEAQVEAELRRRARNFPVAWNQIEKLKPSPELIAAYELYLSIFKEDIDAHLYTAQIAAGQKNYPIAWNHYVAARDLLSKDPKHTEKLETVLLTLIEIGEASKDDKLTQAAYDGYLELSPKKTKENEVRYQKAQTLYDKGDYAASADLLRTIALTPSVESKIRKQAADLSLDAMVLIKDEARLLTWAREYEAAFAGNATDFSMIIQKTLLTRAANLAEKDPAAALAALREMDPKKASPEDKIKYYKNKLFLAEKQGQVIEAADAADALLGQPGISAEDKELAWGRKAYFAELRLDFSNAFAATEKLQASLPVDEKAFKLAVFAELSGRASSPFYMNYLAKTKDEDRKPLVAAELVRKSKNPEAEIEKLKSSLVGSPALMAQLYAEAYAKTGKDTILRKVTGDAKLAATDAGRLLARVAFLKEFNTAKKALAADKMNTSSNNKLAASIKRRAGLLTKAEALATKAIQSGDWTPQLVTIDFVARETDRFYQELLSAPVPAGLTPEEEQEYLSLLSSQAMPYQSRATEAKEKVAQFWQNPDWDKQLTASWKMKALRPVIAVEIDTLKEVAPPEQAAKLTIYRDEVLPDLRPTLQDLQAARQKVFENPMDAEALKNLLALERKSENTTMSDYLSTRLERLTKGTL